MNGLPVFPRFKVHGEEHSLGTRWTKYVGKLENLFIALNVESRKRKKALLLHYAGDDVYEIYETLNLPADINDNYEETKTLLSQYFNPKKNKEFERFEFRNLQQQQDETIDEFATRLRQKAANCEFHDKDSEIKSQIIQGCVSHKLRTKCLETEKTLTELLTMARSMEIASKQAKQMDNKAESLSVNKLKRGTTFKFKGKNQQHQYKPNKYHPPQNRNDSPRKRTCRNCGGEYPHSEKCPALGSKCNYCHKMNHFVRVCSKRLKSHGIRELSEEPSCSAREQNNSDSDSDVTFGLRLTEKVPTVKLTIGGVKTSVLIDTGSSVNVVDESLIGKIRPIPKSEKSSAKIFAFGQKTPLYVKRKYTLDVESDFKIVTAEFQVIKGGQCTLICYQTAVELGLVPIIQAMTNDRSILENDTSLDKYKVLCDKFPKVFDGLGRLKDREIKFHVDESVVPTAQAVRRIPFHVREQVEKELNRLQMLDVIEKAEGPTPWVSNIVVAPKPNSPDEIRLCVDMRKANLALKRERHITPTIDDIILELNGSTVFSKVDLLKGFHQLSLSPESRKMTTFATHVGLFRYKRLNFGVSVAPEIFQNEIRQALAGLPNCLNITDDIVVHGKTLADHDRNLEALLKRLQEKGLTLNKRKCEFGKDKIKFFGYIFSSTGVSADPDKVDAIKSAGQPTNVAEIRSFLGMTNYVSRFIRDYSTISEPLRRLTRKDVKFEWKEIQQKAFEKLKNAIISDQVMTYFDPQKETELWVDGSPVGLSGILVQEGKIVSYGSRSLSPVEQRYSQTERESLACVFGCEHFHLYLFGKPFILVTDHRPLVSIFTNTKQIQSARLERWRLRLTTYNFTIKYAPGHTMISDFCSRHPVQKCKMSTIAEDYVTFIAKTSIPESLSLADVCKATTEDELLQTVIKSVQTKWSKKLKDNNPEYRCYYLVSDELSVVNVKDGDLLLRGTRVCIPDKLQKQTVEIAHVGHQGIVRCKSLLRETCWFPYMDRLIEEKCKSCITCSAISTKTVPDPIKPMPLPDIVWSSVSVDFKVYPSEYYMVIIDDYSRFPLVEKLSGIKAETVIKRLENVFSIFGIPDVIRTDNGPPFNSHVFADFAKRYSFKHRKITPLHPPANAQAESFMKPLGKTIKAAHAENRNKKEELSKFLLNYRCTPHPTTGFAPSELMFNRKVRSKLPSFRVKQNDEAVRNRDTASKHKNKIYADKKRHAKPCSIVVGDSVLVKQRPKTKLDTAFHPVPATVISTKGSMITAKHMDGKVLTRDASHMKKVTHERQNQQDFETTIEKSTLRRSHRQIKQPSRFIKEY